MQIPASVTRAVSRQLLILGKNAPKILFAAGVGSVLSGTVMACRATMKAGPVVDHFHHDIKNVHELHDTNKKNLNESYNEKEYGKDLAYVYWKGTWSLAKLYGPSIAVSAAGVLMLSTSHSMLTRRNAALTSTLALATKAFDDYRGRVRKELGQEKELELYIGEVVDVIDIDEKGDNIVVGKMMDPNTMSVYSKIFDEFNVNWENDAELNRNFIQCQQNFANAQLHARGHIYLNEVYDMLGLRRTKAGQIVGWILRGPNSDNYVDFKLFHPDNAAFVNGYERAIVLDFNVDGNIHNLITWGG